MHSKAISKGILVAVAILVFIAIGIGIWLYTGIITRQAHIASLNNTINEESQKNAALTAFKKVVTETQDQQNKINSYLVDPDNAVGFIEYIESLGNQVDASTTITAVDTVKGDNGKNLKIKAFVQGSWSSVFQFLHVLENVPYKIIINSISLDALSPDAKGVNQWSGTIEFNAVMTQ